MNVTGSIVYIGVDDHDIDLFEGQFDVREGGMSYNSYVILDEKTVVMDTVDAHFTDEWLGNLSAALDGRKPDYLVVQHMEPDHAGSIGRFLEEYPDTVVVSNKKAFGYMESYFGPDIAPKREVVANGDGLSIGTHELQFVFAPFVHWPEVMVTYDSADKVLFTADGFGKFGALDYEDPEGWDCEARRYYFGIVGPYGKNVQKLLAAVSDLDIQTICPLHGPILTEDLGHYIGLYDTWSRYEPEEDGVFVAYTSVYGHTRAAAEKLAAVLEQKGASKVVVSDVSREDLHECVERAFRYSKLALCTTTYNGGIFPTMRNFIENLTERRFQKRTVAFVEAGTWAPQAAKVMSKLLADCPDMTFLPEKVSIRGSMDEGNVREIEALADALMG